MPTDPSTTAPSPGGATFSLDAWAVIIALALALAVRFDVFTNVPW
ncbi:MAG: hypothetical protein WCF68_06055 [Terriglobales bacterium]